MSYSVWILLFITANVYAQTPEAVIPELVCPVCQRKIIPVDTIKYENYIVNNTFVPQECEDCPTKKQKTRRWLERVFFIGGIIAVVIIRVRDE